MQSWVSPNINLKKTEAQEMVRASQDPAGKKASQLGSKVIIPEELLPSNESMQNAPNFLCAGHNQKAPAQKWGFYTCGLAKDAMLPVTGTKVTKAARSPLPSRRFH